MADRQHESEPPPDQPTESLRSPVPPVPRAEPSEASGSSPHADLMAAFAAAVHSDQTPHLPSWLNRVPPQEQAWLRLQLVRVVVEHRRGQGVSEDALTAYALSCGLSASEMANAGLAPATATDATNGNTPRVTRPGDVPAETPAHSTISTDRTAPLRVLFETPRQLDRFRIDAEIGRGGFGVVYRAFDTQLKRVVALKVPKDTLDEHTKERFFREAKATAALDHAGLVPIFEAGETEDGICFIATAFCDGPNLHRWLQQHPNVPCLTAAAFVRDLAEAMQHAHNRGVIHRDLKPANIMAVFGEASGNPADSVALRITDFGLARLYGDHLQETNSSYFWGTPNYMAPELITGSPDAETRPATDIYSLGVILYEILTGQRPFQIKHPLELLEAMKERSVPLPRSLNADVPFDLETICLKCIALDPADRYRTCAELASDLSSFLAGRPIQGRRPDLWDKFLRWARRPERRSETGLLSIALGIGVPIWILLIIVFVAGEQLQADISSELIPQTLAVTIGLLLPLAFIGTKVLSGGRNWLRVGFVLSIVNVALVCPPLFGYVLVFPNLYKQYPLGKIIAYTALTAMFSFQVLQFGLLLLASRRRN